MDIKKIESLAKLLNRQGLTEIEYTEGDMRIHLKKEAATVAVPLQTGVPVPAPAVVPVVEKQASPAGSFINSPMAGIFYAASSPESAPFVAVGDHVRKGSVVCILEAMKLMNELTAEKDCEILEICAKNGDLVEFGQPLFRIA